MAEIRTVKIVVGVMTLLIIVMSGLAVYGISRNAKAVAAGPELGATWSRNLPAGVRIVQVSAAGPALAILATTPQGQRVFLIDPRTGEVRGTLSEAP